MRRRLCLFFLTVNHYCWNVCCCLMQRCEPFINEMRVKWSLSFFSLNFSDTFKSIDWRQRVRIFFDFQRSFIDKVHVLECAFHFFYIKYYTFIMSAKNWQNVTPRRLQPHASKIRKPSPLYHEFWTTTLWYHSHYLSQTKNSFV